MRLNCKALGTIPRFWFDILWSRRSIDKDGLDCVGGSGEVIGAGGEKARKESGIRCRVLRCASNGIERF